MAYSRLRKLEQSLFVKKTDPQACLWIRIARRDQDPQREKSSFHKTSLFQKGNRTFDLSRPFFQFGARQGATRYPSARRGRAYGTTATARGQRPSLTGAALAAARKAMTRLPVGSLRPEPHCHLVGAGLGSSFTHLIREASLACGAGKISIGARVRCGRDHNSIAVDVDIV